MAETQTVRGLQSVLVSEIVDFIGIGCDDDFKVFVRCTVLYKVHGKVNCKVNCKV